MSGYHVHKRYNHGPARERRGEWLNPRYRGERIRNINGQRFQMLVAGGSGVAGKPAGGPYLKKPEARRRANLLRDKGYNVRVIPMKGDQYGNHALFVSKKVRFSKEERMNLEKAGKDWKKLENRR